MFDISSIQAHMQTLHQSYNMLQGGGWQKLEHHANAVFRIENDWLYILGTDDERDWEQNFEGIYTRAVSVCGGRAHSGFSDHADMVVAGLCERHIDPARLHGVVGHSLGGAAAQVIGARFGLPTLTFGSPRVWSRWGKPTGAKEGYHHHRALHRSDVVVGLPPRIRWKHHHHARTKLGRHWLCGLLWRFFTRKPFLYHHYPAEYSKLLAEKG